MTSTLFFNTVDFVDMIGRDAHTHVNHGIKGNSVLTKLEST